MEAQSIQSGKVSFTYRYYPILDHGSGGGESHDAAYAAECANRQGKFWEYHDQLFAAWQGENVGSFTNVHLKKFAANLGLDGGAFTACLDGQQTKAVVEADRAAGQKQNVNGTPAFFVNGTPFHPTGLSSLSGFAAVLGSAP